MARKFRAGGGGGGGGNSVCCMSWQQMALFSVYQEGLNDLATILVDGVCTETALSLFSVEYRHSMPTKSTKESTDSNTVVDQEGSLPLYTVFIQMDAPPLQT